MFSLPADYSFEIDSVSPEAWYNQLVLFGDASIFQTWAYGAARWGESKLRHVVLKHRGRVVSQAQLSIVKAPVLGCGVAFVSRGPSWRLRGETPDPEHLRVMLEALRNHFSLREGLYLKITPNQFIENENESVLREQFTRGGFHSSESSYRTLLIDLSPSVDELRSGLRQSWRKTLNKAEKRGIELVEGVDQSMYDEGLKIHREMVDRKNYAEFVDMELFGKMHQKLPDPVKLRVLHCRFEGQPVSALAWTTLGDVGLPLLGATRPKALELDASYVMFWRMIVRMKEDGLRFCDLAGINPERNPGSYVFKSGMAKKHGLERRLIGEIGVCDGIVSKVAYSAASRIKDLISDARLLKERLGKSSAPDKSVPEKAPVDKSVEEPVAN